MVDPATGLVTPEWASWLSNLAGPTTLPTIVQNEIRNVFSSGGSANLVTWNTLDKTGSSLAHLADRNAAHLTGNLPWSALPVGQGSWLSNLTLGQVTVGGDLTVGGFIQPVVNLGGSLGRATRKFAEVHAGSLVVENIVTQQVTATMGGILVVAPATTLVTGLQPGSTSMLVKESGFAVNDIVRFSARGLSEWVQITSGPTGAGPWSYTITRAYGGGTAREWLAGDSMYSTGTTGDGFIEQYANSGTVAGTGPTIVGWVRTGTAPTNVAARWAIGNLNGHYGYAVDTYGAAFGDNLATSLTVDAFNGFRIRWWNGASYVNRMVIDALGNATFSGSITATSGLITGDLEVGTGGDIRSGATSYTLGTGWWMDYNGGTPRFRVGVPAGNRLAWDGLNLTLVSSSVNIGSTGISVAQDTSHLFSNTHGYSFNGSAAGAIYGLYGSEFTVVNNFRALDLYNTVSGSTASIVALKATNSSAGRAFGISCVAGVSLAFDGLALTGSTDSIVKMNDSTFTMKSGIYLYPGSSSGLTDFQTTYYLSSHASWGLFTNANVAAGGGFFSASGAGQGFSFTGDTDTGIDNDSADRLRLRAGAIHLFWDGTQFFPETDGARNLGHPSFRWNTVYATVGVINTSDRRQKRGVADTAFGRNFLMALRPVDFEWTATPGVRHSGFIAQDVDFVAPLFGGLSRDEYGEATGLNYSEFIAPLVAGFQDHERRLRALEHRV